MDMGVQSVLVGSKSNIKKSFILDLKKIETDILTFCQ